MNISNTGGYASTAGNRIFQHPAVVIDKGIEIPKQPTMSPLNAYRAKQWYATKPLIQAEKGVGGIRIGDEWTRRRVRDNQKGLKASEQIHGQEWYPVKMDGPQEPKPAPLLGASYNIHAATYRYGRSELPPKLGKDLSQGDQLLQRAPGDYFITTNSTHNDQTIVDPSGVATGVEGIKLK